MKALSIRQPWAWAILHAGKRVENRTWSSSFRGTFLLHAAKGCSASEYLEAVKWMVSMGLARSPISKLNAMNEIVLRVADIDPAKLPLVPPLEEMPRGGIVGRARLANVLQPTGRPLVKWHSPTQFGFLLEDVEPLPFVPLRGFQLLFNVPEDAAQVTP